VLDVPVPEIPLNTPKGVVIFETLNLYGVDRCNRQNLADYGNKDRPAKICFRRILRRNNS
jgi:hypothetical protein